MNTNRGIKHTVQSLLFFLGGWELFCLVKIIQNIPSEAESIIFNLRLDYWRAIHLEPCKTLTDKNLRIDCSLEALRGVTKDFLLWIGPAGEWLLIGLITFFVVLALLYILIGFLDEKK